MNNRSLLLAAGLALAASSARATDVFVDQSRGSDVNDGLSWASAKATIQSAVDVAITTPEPDTVRIAEGRYHESVEWSNHPVTLQGGHESGGAAWDPSRYVTVIDGQGVRDRLLVGWSISEPCSIEGLTITGATNIAVGLGCRGLVMSRCIVERNGWVRQPRGMAGIAVQLRSYNPDGSGLLLVEDCTFRDNAYLLTGFDQYRSAALFIYESSIATIRRCVFERNWHEGVGLADFDRDSSTNIVFEDVSMDAAWATIAFVTARNTLFRRYCVVSEGLFYLSSFTNVTAGRIDISYSSADPVVITDSILTGIVDGVAGPPIVGWQAPPNVRIDHSLVRGGWPAGTNILDADPLFVGGPLGDHYLAQTSAGDPATSPAVDAGSRDVAAASLQTTTTRADGAADAGIVDMGYHYPESGPLIIRRAALPTALIPHATTSRLPWTDAPGTLSDPALPLLFYDIPGATNELFVTRDRASDAPRLSWQP